MECHTPCLGMLYYWVYCILFISLEVLHFQGASVLFIFGQNQGAGRLESENVAQCDCRNATYHSCAGEILWTDFSKEIKWRRMAREKS